MVKRSRHTMCSNACWNEFNKKETRSSESYNNIKCPICGTMFHLNKYEANNGCVHCCSKECMKKHRSERMKGKGNHQYGIKGKHNASWKSDKRISSYGYVLIRCPDHPFANIDGFVFEHRLIAEKYLLTEDNSIDINGKRYLRTEYDVHHIDENRENNAIENLLVVTRSEHKIIHEKISPMKRDSKTGRFLSK